MMGGEGRGGEGREYRAIFASPTVLNCDLQRVTAITHTIKNFEVSATVLRLQFNTTLISTNKIQELKKFGAENRK
jgi:hypothetical protein